MPGQSDSRQLTWNRSNRARAIPYTRMRRPGPVASFLSGGVFHYVANRELSFTPSCSPSPGFLTPLLRWRSERPFCKT